MRDHLSGRDKWQDEAASRGALAEEVFGSAMISAFEGTHYEFIRKPNQLKDIYGDGRGIKPDFSIRNKKTDKTIWVEIKRQRKFGNAHERACKYFAPGIVNIARQRGNLAGNTFPFWLVFTNGLANDEHKRTEISFWFFGIEEHCFLWQDLEKTQDLHQHFKKFIAPVID